MITRNVAHRGIVLVVDSFGHRDPPICYAHAVSTILKIFVHCSPCLSAVKHLIKAAALKLQAQGPQLDFSRVERSSKY